MTADDLQNAELVIGHLQPATDQDFGTFEPHFRSHDKANEAGHPASMTNEELFAEVLKLSQMMRQYAEFSTQFAKQTDAKIKELQLEVQALRFTRELQDLGIREGD